MRAKLAGAAALAVMAGAAGAAAQADVTAVHAGVLLAAPGEAGARERQTVLIEDGRITAIEDGFVTPDGAEVVDLSDMTVLPGLIDCHVHLLGEFSPSVRLDAVTQDDADQALNGARHARVTLEAGFTTVRDVGGGRAIFALRDAVRDGDVVGPRIQASGPPITPSGGHGTISGYRPEIIAALTGGNVCNGVADCRRAVREAVQGGADFIKITATGGVLSNTAAGVGQQFFPDELEAIVDTARMMGREVTAHAHGADGVEAALEAGVASIEHGTYLTEDIADMFVERGAYLVPTALAGATVGEWARNTNWLPPASRDKALEVGPRLVEMLAIARAAGAPIAFGTDTGVSPHGENAREFELMVAAGFTPEEAIAAATLVAAEHIDLGDEIGRIAPGYAADIIAVDGDPLADVSELLDVDFVMHDGRVIVAPDAE